MTSADDREDARAGRDRTPDTTGSHRRSETAGFATGHGPTHGSSTPLAPEQHDDTARDSLIGTDRGHRTANTSWGAIFAGTVTFLAILVVFALASAALGLSEASGIAVSIWGVVALVVALAVAGYIAGALAVRSGLRCNQPYRISAPIRTAHCRPTYRRRDRGTPLQRTPLPSRRRGASHRLHPSGEPALRRHVRAHRHHPNPAASPRPPRPITRRARGCCRRVERRRLRPRVRQHHTPGHAPTVLTPSA